MSTAVSALFSPVSILLFGVSFLLLSHFIKKSTTPNFAPLPPAPKGYPVIDNLLDIPSQHVAKHFLKIHEELKSPIVRLSALGTNLIDISDLKLAKELLEKRAHINSCRASSLYFRKYVDPLSRHWTLYPHDKVHRLGRRLAMQAMSTVRAGRTLKLQTMESRCTLNNLVDIYQKGDVELWRDEMARFAASLITSAVYGFQCFSTEEPHLKELVDITNITVAGVQQPSIINVLPFLDLIPGPMPWRSAAAANHRKRENTFYNDLAYEAIKGGRSDIDTWCKQFFLADDGDNDAALTNPKRGDRVILATQLVGAGNETTSNTLSTFTLAYLTHPEAFQGAIEQIQRVVGSDRLPEFSDRDELPLIDAIPRELLRWRPGVPSAIPHLATEDQLISFQDDSGETKEYFIPAGSLLLPNQLAIDSDPKNWDQPEKLIPERWLKDGKLVDYENYAFGWGGRVCPGQPFAERSLFISIACILWGFTAEKVNDPKTGKPFVYDDAAMTGEFTCQPLPFPCKLVPRSQRHINIIRESWEHQEKDLNNLMAWSK